MRNGLSPSVVAASRWYNDVVMLERDLNYD